MRARVCVCVCRVWEGVENENNTHKQTNYRCTHAPHTVFDIDPGESSNMSSFIAFELTHAAPHSVCWKERAPLNIDCMLVTWDTAQLDRSWLKDSAKSNIDCMFVTRDTSHLDKSWLKDSA